MWSALPIGGQREWSIGYEVHLPNANTCGRDPCGGPCRWGGCFGADAAGFQYHAWCRLGLQPDRLHCDDLRADRPSAGAGRENSSESAWALHVRLRSAIDERAVLGVSGGEDMNRNFAITLFHRITSKTPRANRDPYPRPLLQHLRVEQRGRLRPCSTGLQVHRSQRIFGPTPSRIVPDSACHLLLVHQPIKLGGPVGDGLPRQAE
jgi:hypothetical protein